MTTSDKIIKIAENEAKVFEKGRQAEYDAFWDGYQENGNRTSYNSAFLKRGWNDITFKPKYDMQPTTANTMFSESYIEDLVGILEQQGVSLDFSQCTTMNMAFYFCTNLLTVPVLDTRATTKDGTTGTFYYLFGSDAKLQSIEKIILKDDGSQMFNNAFSGCFALKEVRFEGVIGQDGLKFNDSYHLSKESIISIINALSATTSGLTVSFYGLAVKRAFETSAGAVDGNTSAEWQELIATKSNWNISLV